MSHRFTFRGVINRENVFNLAKDVNDSLRPSFRIVIEASRRPPLFLMQTTNIFLILYFIYFSIGRLLNIVYSDHFTGVFSLAITVFVVVILSIFNSLFSLLVRRTNLNIVSVYEMDFYLNVFIFILIIGLIYILKYITDVVHKSFEETTNNA